MPRFTGRNVCYIKDNGCGIVDSSTVETGIANALAERCVCVVCVCV